MKSKRSGHENVEGPEVDGEAVEQGKGECWTATQTQLCDARKRPNPISPLHIFRKAVDSKDADAGCGRVRRIWEGVVP